MSKGVKKIYRVLGWFFSAVLAASTLTGCWGAKYGPPKAGKYGPPPATEYGPPSISRHIETNDSLAQGTK